MDNRHLQLIEKYCKEHHLDKNIGAFTLGECKTCGTLLIAKVEPEKPYTLELIDITEECPNCQEVFRRAPELVLWTLNVLAKLKNEILQEKT